MSLAGRMLKGTYLVGRKLAGGGMGVIYDASHVRLPRRYAIKVLTAELSGNEQAVGRFKREAEIVAALGHANIVDVVDFDQLEGGELYMVMELLQGEDLAARLRRGPLSMASTLRVFRDVCGALDVAHDAGIVHRDLKPANVFLIARDGRDDFAKILDFGISKVAAETTKLTADRAIMGTPCYMSPEQAQGDTHAIDRRTDVFALGAILYECLTGQVAFGGDSLLSILYKITQQPRPSVLALRPDLSPALDAVVQRACALSRDDRFARAGELHAALVAACGDVGVAGATPVAVAVPSAGAFVPPTTLSAAAGQASSVAPSVVPSKRTKRIALGVGVVGALAAAGVAIAVVSRGGGREREARPSTTIAAPPEPTPKPVTLEVRSTPSGAQVTLDGKKLDGATPVQLELSPGHHVVEVAVPETTPPVVASTPRAPRDRDRDRDRDSTPPPRDPPPDPPREPDAPKMSYDDAMSEARSKLKAGDYGVALRAAEAALRAKPGDSDAAMTATVAACGLGARDKAQRLLPSKPGSHRDIALQRCSAMGIELPR